MNGVLNQLSQDYAFRQDGGIWAWSALADYDAGRLVRGSDGSLYISVAVSGPSVVAGAKDPTADDGTYWMYMVTEQWVRDNFAPNILYLDATNGDDNNSGLTESAPLKTVAAAMAKLIGIKAFSTGTKSYVKLVLMGGNFGDVIYEGNDYPPLWFEGRADATLTQLRVTGATQVKLSGTITFSSDSSSISQIYCGSNTYILTAAGATITHQGTCSNCFRVTRNSTLYIDAAHVFSNVTVTNGTARAGELANITIGTGTMAGTATGRHYYVSNMGLINTGGGGENFFPGTTAGSVSASSLYL
jgi:hypothetical protein